MEELTFVLVVVFGFLSLILFFKVWGMCNNVKKIQGKVMEEAKYRFNVNTEVYTLNAELKNAKELIFCDKKEDAKYELKRLLYQFVLEKKEWERIPYKYGQSHIEDLNKRATKVIELLESIGETIENKEDIFIPTDK